VTERGDGFRLFGNRVIFHDLSRRSTGSTEAHCLETAAMAAS
jgi:hypothetical protein